MNVLFENQCWDLENSIAVSWGSHPPSFLWGSVCYQHFTLTLLTGNSSCGSIFSSLVCFNSPENHTEYTSHLCQLFLCEGSHKASLISQASPRGHCCCFWGKAGPDSTQKPRTVIWIKKHRRIHTIGSSGKWHMTNWPRIWAFSPWQRNNGCRWLRGEVGFQRALEQVDSKEQSFDQRGFFGRDKNLTQLERNTDTMEFPYLMHSKLQRN